MLDLSKIEAGQLVLELSDYCIQDIAQTARSTLEPLAAFERHLILARTSESRHRTQQRGVRFGRKPKLTAHQQQEALARQAAGEALVDITRSYAVSHSTMYLS